MFALHETTQRRVCRSIFLLACIVPTIATVASIAYVHRPWRARDWERTLSEQLHVRAEVGDIDSPRPGLTRLTHVRLTDLRSQRLLVALKEVSFERRGSVIIIQADHLEAEKNQFPAMSEAVFTWLSTRDLPAIDLHVQRLTIGGPSLEALQMDDLRLRSESGGAGVNRLRLSAAPARQGDNNQTSPMQLTVECQQGAAGSVALVALDTREVRLPTWLVRDVIPGIGSCRGSTFFGSLQMKDDGVHLGGAFSGQVAGIDLQQFLGSGSPHRWEGSATVDLERLRWQEGRINVAEGRLHAGRGLISRSLLGEFITRLYCVAATASADDLPAVGVDELACRFQLTGAGITLKGDCQTDVAGCLLVSQGAPWLLEPPNRIPWVAQLVQVFHLPAKSWLPATREALDVSDALPIPSAAPGVASRRRSDDAARSLSR